MNKLIAGALACVAPIVTLHAQNDSLDIVLDSEYQIEDSIYSNYEENLDSLVNLWYVGQSIDNETVSDILDSALVVEIPDFSDSVYMARLAAIPTTVPLTYNKIVRSYINMYTKQRRDKVEIMLGLSQHYFPIFDEIFDYYDIPNEMKYMSIIESALNPKAYSRTRAVGLWQFMYGTGKLYGLDVNSLVDERRDPIKSTDAACRFVKDLYGMYGDWLLAIAAYNCGPGNVNRAIRRSGGKKDFWSIYYFLPRETRGHIPAFIAATYVMNYYADHNLQTAPIDLPVPSDTVMVTQRLHLKQVSEVLNVPLKQLQDLNPQYRYDIIPGNTKPYPLCLPLEASFSFAQYEDSIYSYKDSIYLKQEQLAMQPESVHHYVPQAPGDNYARLYYTVKPGDNLGFIADWYDVKISDLRYWNNINRNLIRSGQKLVVYVPKSKVSRYEKINNVSNDLKKQAVASAPTASNQVSASGDYTLYTVRSGDTLWEIAKRYPGVSDSDIMKWNNLNYHSKIQPGQKLRIYKKG